MMGATSADHNAEELSRQVAGIMAMGQVELETAWGKHCRGKPPAGLPCSLLARLLAFKVQVAAHGDVSPTQQRFLERVARDLSAGIKHPKLQLNERFQLKPGTVLVRQHNGEHHRVMVLADGFAWNSQVHLSLSAVATAITGTRWNGHRFFGLDAASKARRGAGTGDAGVSP